MINAHIQAHSINRFGFELVTLTITIPRIILAEVNTHKMLVKNTSSSRAIPFYKNLETILTNPFIPMAWQTHHSGMQGSAYVDMDSVINVGSFFEQFIELIKNQAKVDKFVITKDFEECLNTLKVQFIDNFANRELTIKQLWLKTRDLIATASSILYTIGKVSKQICNRLLEPFMWTTITISGNRYDGGWENFFELRCPQYSLFPDTPKYRSVEEYKRAHINDSQYNTYTQLDWLRINRGMAEIHMMDIAEKIYDCISNSVPEELEDGQWHLPFKKHIDIGSNVYVGPSATVENVEKLILKVSTSMIARTSYTVIGNEKTFSYDSHINLHDDLVNAVPLHASPMEHPGRNMTGEELYNHSKVYLTQELTPRIIKDIDKGISVVVEKTKDGYKVVEYGWCKHYRGFIPYRQLLELNAK